ncbi:MAG: helix-turn-helix transcriptional regulator [Candidatus Latescibacteria bacterium]|nr:helix-turn-helix transcriptional regulator [Candidatus Latescibacterota bacterium]
MENDRPVSTTPGAMVRAAREAAGLSLADLAAATRIPASQLRALEADDHDQLSGPLYVRSFLRSCAEALDLDPHDLLAAYDSRRPADAAIPAPGPTWTQETQIRHAAAFPWRRVGLLAAVLLAVALAVLAIVRIAGGGGAPAAEADADPGRSRREALGDSLREAWSPLTSLTTTDSLALAAADSALADSVATGFAGGDGAAAALPDSAAADSLGAPPVAAQARVVVPSADELAVLASLPAGDGNLAFADGARWPLVLRVVTRGRIDYAVGADGQRNAPNVVWLARPSGLPAEGVTAGVVYSLGWRNVSYWGARDHFLLKLSAAEDVTVTLNGRPLPIPTRLVGREWVLDRSLLDR